MHMSKGEGRERHIDVFKADCKQPDAAQKTNSVTSDSLSSAVSVTEVSSCRQPDGNDILSSQVQNCSSDIEDIHTLPTGERINGSWQSCEAVVRNTDVTGHRNSNVLTEADDILDKTSSTVPTLCCSNCGRQIPQANYQLHLLHCKTLLAKSTSKKSKDKRSNKVTCCFNVNDYYIKV